MDDILSKWKGRHLCHFNGCTCKRKPNDAEGKNDGTDKPKYSNERATKNEPDYISSKAH